MFLIKTTKKGAKIMPF